MKLLCDGLMCTPPERPCDDVGRIDASSREALRYASNLLDRPADEMERRVFLGIDLYADQRVDRSPSWAPCGEVREISVCDVAPDQQATCPQAMVFLVELSRAEISQFQVAPV